MAVFVSGQEKITKNGKNKTKLKKEGFKNKLTLGMRRRRSFLNITKNCNTNL